MTSGPEPADETNNVIIGGIAGNVVQAGHIDVVHFATPVPVALAGLPAEVGFTDRVDEQAGLAALLDPEAKGLPSVATITGLPGIGKTALAVRAAHEAVAAGWFPGGVLFIDLHGYDPAGGVSVNAALLAMLGELGTERAPATQGERENRYRSILAEMADRGRRVLVLADNVSDVAQANALRPGSPVHRMLITSRDNLPVPGARRVELGVLRDVDAVGVMAQALEAAMPGDTRVADEPQEAIRLAQLCEGLPLALRIVAELLADRPRHGIGRLVRTVGAATDRLDMLSYGESVAVRAAFDTSYLRLPRTLARLFRLLSLHPGPHIGVGAVAALANVSENEACRLAEGLCRAHLIEPSIVPDCYRFHDLVRLYSGQCCETDEQPADRAAAVSRLLGYYRAATQAVRTHLDSRTPPEHKSWLFGGRSDAVAWSEGERPNLIPVVSLSARCGLDDLTCEVVSALHPFFELRNHPDEWITIAKFGLAAALRLGDQFAEGQSLTALGLAHQELQWYDEARDYHGQALAVCRRTGDRLGQAKALINVGGVSYQLGQFEDAESRWEEALTIAWEREDRYLAARTLNNLGFLSALHRRYGLAESRYRQALACARELGDPQAEGGVLTNLGAVLQRTGRHTDAVECHRQALDVLAQSGDRLRAGRALHNMALVYQDLGQWGDASACHRRALALRREIGDRHGEGLTLTQLGRIHARQGQREEALTCQRQALAAFVQTGATGDADEVRGLIDELTA
ncbi:ATP-binding protein [Kutzneria kofuensis]|uniref:Tetratricopeptide (TPR) repeat protein n=1 Tax=Kutzneria kofuensis TaxID=103725 RepID=A0A7W9KQZ4_9PSEU|nr:tetratricopeptide repeat protein [Kutzneria kofuensis]MBB5896404.1 tetratricopeptide (TPR) repeat protein [Kutzneria kofuensis]